MILIGEIVKKKWPKQEHEDEVVCIETKTRTLKLRRQGGSPFNDPELEKLVGQEIAAEGEIGRMQHGNRYNPDTFFATKLEPSDIGMARKIMQAALEEIEEIGVKTELIEGKDFLFYLLKIPDSR